MHKSSQLTEAKVGMQIDSIKSVAKVNQESNYYLTDL